MSLLVDINSKPHIKCTCKVSFVINKDNIFASRFDGLNEQKIVTRCPNCFMVHTYYDCVDILNEYFSIIDPINKYEFKSDNEAFNYFVNHCVFLRTLEST